MKPFCNYTLKLLWTHFVSIEQEPFAAYFTALFGDGLEFFLMNISGGFKGASSLKGD